MKRKMKTSEQVRRLSEKGNKPAEIAKLLGISVQRVYQVRSNLKAKERNRITVSPTQVALFKKLSASTSAVPTAPALPITMEEPKSDPVNHPAHYKAGGIETIDFIEAKHLNYNLGNVIKYITRSDLKGNRKQDLEKAMWYLKREIEKPHQPA